MLGDKKKQTLRPFTVYQLNEAVQPIPDSLYKVDDQDVHLVKIVGQVIQQQQQSTNISYSIDDGTGMIVAQQFGDHEHESFDQAYVQVYGQLRSFQQKKVVNVSKIIKLHSLDQVTLHFLDVIRYKVKPVTQNAQPVKSTVTLESQIIQFFMDTRDTTNGGNINNLIMSLRGVASEAEIRNLVENLSNDGTIYSTTDDHYKATGDD